MPNNDDELFPLPLRERITSGSVVAFIGAGFTIPLGFPNWKQLLRNLLDFCRPHSLSPEGRAKLSICERLIAADKLTDAAWELKRLLQRADYAEFFLDQFSVRQKENNASQETKERMERRRLHLNTAPWAGIVTTNFDDYIQSGSIDVNADGSDPKLGYILSRREKFYVKLHSGRWQDDMIFTSADYYDAYLAGTKAPRIPYFLKTLMLSYPLVFIGCSLEDRLLEIRRELSQVFSRYLPKAWALVPETHENTDRAELLKQEFQIDLIPYHAEEPRKPPHAAVDRFLELAAACRPPLDPPIEIVKTGE